MAWDAWDLSAYGRPKTNSTNKRTTDPYDLWKDQLTGRTTTVSPSGNVKVTRITDPNGMYSGYGEAARAGTLAGQENPLAWYNSMFGQTPTYNPGGGGGGRGGGGGGAPAVDTAAIMGALNAYRPQMKTWNDVSIPEYKPPEFYGFDQSVYDQMRNRIAQAITGARTMGTNAIGEARTQIGNIPLAFQTAPTTTDPGMSAAMQRMYAANNVPTSINAQTMNEGVQADQAFGNLYAILGENARQKRASDLYALTGDQRRLNEQLDQQSLMMNAGVDLALAQAKRQHEIDKWMFGEDVARANYDTAVQNIMYNAQGRQEVANANVDTANATNANAMQALVDLLSAGVQVDPASYQQVTV